MSKKIFKIFFILICSFLLISNVDAKSLKSLKEQLKKDEANMAALIKKEKEIQKKIDEANKETSSLTEKIVEYQEEIEASRVEIDELEESIKEKHKEIDSLLSFLQLSNGENVYLEYVFQATSFTDFIYRNSIVEQLSKYNDNLINEMHTMIEENKALQKKLDKQIKDSESSIKSLEEVLKKYDLDIGDLDDEQESVEESIKARKVEIKGFEEAYKKNKCSEDMEIDACLGVPYSDSFTRPLTQGKVTSEFGIRKDPVTGKEKSNHRGIDLGGNPQGTPIYASAAGRVTKTVKNGKEVGNAVYIQHTVKGKRYRTVYMHMKSINVKPNDYVTITTVIGTVGNTGKSTGAHLHFAIIEDWTPAGKNGKEVYLDPRKFVKFPAFKKKFTTRFY